LIESTVMATGVMARKAFFALRREIARIEGRMAERFDVPQKGAARPASGAYLLRTGSERFDEALGGGLPSSGLLEVHGHASRDAGAAVGFVLALSRLLAAGRATTQVPEKYSTVLRRKAETKKEARQARQSDASLPGAPLLWIGTSEIFREAGQPYAPGLAAPFGIPAESLLIAEAEKLADVLWIAEEAARLDSFMAVLLEIRGSPHRLDLTATRRLHRRALISGLPFFLIRESGEPEPTAAPVRLVVAAASAVPRVTLAGPLAGSIGPPAFHVTISKSRTSIPAAFTLEWNDDAFRERRQCSAKDFVPVVPVPSRGPAVQAAVREGLALPRHRVGAAADLQPVGEQHKADRRARRAS
jgi:protein ImuA